MVEIIAEFHYWHYGEYTRNAMESRPEIKTEDLKKIAREFNIKIETRKANATYFALGRISWKFPNYSKIIVQVTGDHSEDVKTVVSRIFLLYGRPDEVPLALVGGRGRGRKIIEELLREFNKGER